MAMAMAIAGVLDQPSFVRVYLSRADGKYYNLYFVQFPEHRTHLCGV